MYYIRQEGNELVKYDIQFDKTKINALENELYINTEILLNYQTIDSLIKKGTIKADRSKDITIKEESKNFHYYLGITKSQQSNLKSNLEDCLIIEEIKRIPITIVQEVNIFLQNIKKENFNFYFKQDENDFVKYEVILLNTEKLKELATEIANNCILGTPTKEFLTKEEFHYIENHPEIYKIINYRSISLPDNLLDPENDYFNHPERVYSSSLVSKNDYSKLCTYLKMHGYDIVPLLNKWEFKDKLASKNWFYLTEYIDYTSNHKHLHEYIYELLEGKSSVISVFENQIINPMADLEVKFNEIKDYLKNSLDRMSLELLLRQAKNGIVSDNPCVPFDPYDPYSDPTELRFFKSDYDQLEQLHKKIVFNRDKKSTLEFYPKIMECIQLTEVSRIDISKIEEVKQFFANENKDYLNEYHINAPIYENIRARIYKLK